MKLLAITVLAGLLSWPALSAEMLSKEEARADFEYLYTSLENVHPDFFRNRDRAATDALATQIESKLTAPISTWDFYRLVAPFAAGALDGHTFVRPPERFSVLSQADRIILPFDVSVTGFQITVEENYSDSDALPVGTTIDAINGHSARDIILNFRSQYADIVTKDDVYGMAFAAFLNSGFGPNTEFVIRTGDGNKVTVAGINREERTKRKEALAASKDEHTSGENYRLYFPPEKEGVAVIEVLAMEDVPAFKAFAEDAFKQLGAQAVNTLIIDFRNNYGGDSRIGDAIATYIHPSSFDDWQATIKVSDQFRSHFSEDIAADPALAKALSAPDGQLVEEPDLPTPPLKPSTDLLFGGEVYLLTSGFTYSSASMFSGIFKCADMGTIVGQATGQATNFFGELTQMTMPNSGMNFLISMKEFKAPCNVSMTEGVQPDVVLPAAEDALAHVLAQ